MKEKDYFSRNLKVGLLLMMVLLLGVMLVVAQEGGGGGDVGGGDTKNNANVGQNQVQSGGDKVQIEKTDNVEDGQRLFKLNGEKELRVPDGSEVDSFSKNKVTVNLDSKFEGKLQIPNQNEIGKGMKIEYNYFGSSYNKKDIENSGGKLTDEDYLKQRTLKLEGGNELSHGRVSLEYGEKGKKMRIKDSSGKLKINDVNLERSNKDNEIDLAFYNDGEEHSEDGETDYLSTKKDEDGNAKFVLKSGDEDGSGAKFRFNEGDPFLNTKENQKVIDVYSDHFSGEIGKNSAIKIDKKEDEIPEVTAIGDYRIDFGLDSIFSDSSKGNLYLAKGSSKVNMENYLKTLKYGDTFRRHPQSPEFNFNGLDKGGKSLTGGFQDLNQILRRDNSLNPKIIGRGNSLSILNPGFDEDQIPEKPAFEDSHFDPGIIAKKGSWYPSFPEYKIGGLKNIPSLSHNPDGKNSYLTLPANEHYTNEINVRTFNTLNPNRDVIARDARGNLIGLDARNLKALQPQKFAKEFNSGVATLASNHIRNFNQEWLGNRYNYEKENLFLVHSPNNDQSFNFLNRDQIGIAADLRNNNLLKSSINHEISHSILNRASPNLPVAIHEGIASSFDDIGRKNIIEGVSKDFVNRGNYPNLEEIFNSNSGFLGNNLANQRKYAASVTAKDYLLSISGGDKNKYFRFGNDVGIGKYTYSQALNEYYGINGFLDFQKKYESYMKKRYR